VFVCVCVISGIRVAEPDSGSYIEEEKKLKQNSSVRLSFNIS